MNISLYSPTAQLKQWLSRLAAATLRDTFAIQMIAAVLLSVLLSDLAGFDYLGWAALRSYAVMNTSVKASTVRAFNRVTCTHRAWPRAGAVAECVSHSGSGVFGAVLRHSWGRGGMVGGRLPLVLLLAAGGGHCRMVAFCAAGYFLAS